MSELLKFLLSHEEQFRRARLPSLYSDFRLQQATNPDGFEANLIAWETGLTHAVKAGLIPGGRDVFSLRMGEPLLRALETREWGRPLALAPVIAAAVLDGRMISSEDFLTARTSIYDRQWSLAPWQFVSRGLKMLGLTGLRSTKAMATAGRYVLVKNVEEAAGRVMASIDKRDNRVERVVPLAVFSAEIEKALGLSYGMTPEDLEILLVHLSRDQKYLAHDQSVVKLKGKGEERADITAEDINIASLKSLMVGLHVQLEELTQKISNYEKKARSAVAAKNRVLATASLRSKKLYESILAQRSETLAQLEGVYFTLEEASDQLEIVRVMQASTKILKGLRLEIGGMDTVEHVLEALTTEMNHVDGIGAVMSENAQVNNMVDESVIDEELDALERQDQRRKDEQGASETEKRLELLGGPNPTKSDFTPIGHSEPSESISQRKRTSTKDRQRETDESQQPEEFTQQREFLITS